MTEPIHLPEKVARGFLIREKGEEKMKTYDVLFIENIEHWVVLDAENAKEAEEKAKRVILDCYDNNPETWPEKVWDFTTESLGVAPYPNVSERK